MAVDSSSRPTYSDVIGALRTNIQNPEVDAKINNDTLILWINQACQEITNKVRLTEKRELLLIQSQTDYLFDNVTEPVTGTGTINSTANALAGVTTAGTGTITASETDITGVGTLFIAELAVGKAIKVGTEIKEVMSIASNTSCVIKSAFDATVSASAFTISSTKFTRELVVGSIIVSNSQTRTIATITDPMTATVTAPLTTDLVAQTFTVDTSVQKIPTRFHRINRIERSQSNISRQVAVEAVEDITDTAVGDGSPFYDTYDIPLKAGEWRDGSGRRYMRVYSTLDDHKQVTIYGDIKIEPRYYASNTESSVIPLYEQHEPMIRDWVTAHIYLTYMNDFNMYRFNMGEFNTKVKEFNLNTPNTVRVAMVYS
jgi:hypothetical protein